MIWPTTLAKAVRAAGQSAMRLVDPEPAPPILSVTIAPRPAVKCELLWRTDMVDADETAMIARRQLAWRDTIFLLAGPIAELHWRHDNRAIVRYAMPVMSKACLGAAPPAYDSDLGDVRQRLLWARPDDPTEAFAIAYEHAEASVARWWPHIATLAHLLAQEGSLDGEQVASAWRDTVAARGMPDRAAAV